MRAFNRVVLESTPAVVPAAYGNGDQIGGVNTLSSICADTKGIVLLETITILDKAKQSSALDLLFFQASPTLTSTDNNPIDISDAEMVKCLGVMKIAASDYSTLANSSIASVSLTRILQSVANSKDLFYVVVSRGTPTYVSATDLVLKFGVSRA